MTVVGIASTNLDGMRMCDQDEDCFEMAVNSLPELT